MWIFSIDSEELHCLFLEKCLFYIWDNLFDIGCGGGCYNYACDISLILFISLFIMILLLFLNGAQRGPKWYYKTPCMMPCYTQRGVGLFAFKQIH